MPATIASEKPTRFFCDGESLPSGSYMPFALTAKTHFCGRPAAADAIHMRLTHDPS
jgi:hypothetical protein